jgi:prepilin-type N-terminal cleavage/methylation domain-containing protein
MSLLTRRSSQARGFSLVEVLLVLAIMGILSSIAIPSYLGQRRRARVIGDAISNTKVLQMALESRRAELGTYGTAGTTSVWKADGTRPATDLAPGFSPKGNSKMDYSLLMTNGGLSYVLTVTDPSLGDAITYQTNETGAELARLQ